MKRLIYILIFFSPWTYGQELFPNTEPASTIPAGVFGKRYSFQGYNAGNQQRQWHAARLMYGVNSKLTVIGSLIASNHHLREIPPNVTTVIFNHNAVSNSELFPMAFKGGHLYAKYRFLSLDGPNRHLRMAIYGEASKTDALHFEAEPNLMGYNSGLGGGVISTFLYKKLALSTTGGFINPARIQNKTEDIRMRSGNGMLLDISAGYLLFPGKYKSYKDLNINLYGELLNRFYGSADLNINSLYKDPGFFPALQSGRYSEFRGSVQFIIHSNTRLDLSIGIPVYSTYAMKAYPLYALSIQQYLF
ncbi:MAG: hypothetical protein ACK4ND_17110 [Cytophagaceae bacterium]